MSESQSTSELKPLLSIFIIIVTLFTIVFIKMEARRMGYQLLKNHSEHRALKDDFRRATLAYAQLSSPRFLKQAARSKLTLSDARAGQIIYISGDQIALKQ